MTYPEGREPLGADDMAKMHPSTWEAEAKALRAENQELALQVLATTGQAEEAYQAQLSAESAARWANIKAEQAINEAKALRAENERLRAALAKISKRRDLTDKSEYARGYNHSNWMSAKIAFAALQKQEGE